VWGLQKINMIAYASMLVSAAEKAGMKVPVDSDNFVPEEFPHFHVFCLMQLGAAVPYHGCHWDNAKVIAEIPDEEIKSVTMQDILLKGFAWKF
jgi:hypothetical protein